MASTTVASGSRITRDDLEAKFREIEEGTRQQVASAKPTLVGVGATLAIILALVIFFLGQRAGRKRTTIVEIRRV
jgi:hypothetical protein